GAADDEVKRAYRRRARKHHPDLSQGDRESEAKSLENTKNGRCW
ncbi:MAG: DnaJ domain-containing protein, partial [Pseudomonadota bacterium]